MSLGRIFNVVGAIIDRYLGLSLLSLLPTSEAEYTGKGWDAAAVRASALSAGAARARRTSYHIILCYSIV